MSTGATAAAIGIKITADPKDAEKAIDQLDKRIGGFGKKRGRYATEFGELRDLAGKGVDGLEKLTWGFGRATASAAKFGIGLGVVGATAAAVGIVDMGVQFATAGAIMGRTATRLGLPVEKLSQLQIAARLAGSSAEDMTGSLQGLQDTVNAAANGQNNDAFAEFKAAGINIGSASNAAKNWLSVLPKIADQYKLLAKTNPHAALLFLDKVGISRDLSPMLQDGAAGLKQYLDQAQQFGRVTAEQAARGRELEKVLTGLGLTWQSFGLEAGASVAPALTATLGELEKFLIEHKEDVTQFFHDLEQGLEWLVKPQGRVWIRQELDEITEGVKHLYQLALEMEHSPLVRRLLGLPVDPADLKSNTPLSNGIPTEGNGGGLQHALEGAPVGAPSLLERGWNWMTGNKSVQSASIKALSKTSMDSLIAKGWSPGDAAGIIGNLQQESSLNPLAGVNTLTGHLGAHIGIAQWDATRQKAIADHFGKRVEDMTLQEQLDAVHWELTEGKYKGVGDQLRGGSHRATDAAVTIDHAYEIPANPGTPELANEDAHRSANAQAVIKDYGASDGAVPAYSSPGYAQSDRRDKLTVEVIHTNPPPNSTISVTSADPSQINVLGPKVMGAMPSAGTPRNVARDGF